MPSRITDDRPFAQGYWDTDTLLQLEGLEHGLSLPAIRAIGMAAAQFANPAPAVGTGSYLGGVTVRLDQELSTQSSPADKPATEKPPERWKPATHWETHPKFTPQDWIDEVFIDATRLGYVDWVNARLDEKE